MERTNKSKVTDGFDALIQVLSPYVIRELTLSFGDGWWQIAVLGVLRDHQKMNLPISGDYNKLASSIDVALALLLIEIHWTNVFSKKLPKKARSWAHELHDARNERSHDGAGEDYSDRKATRILDTMSFLCEQIDPDETLERINSLLRSVQYGSAEGSVSGSNNTTAKQGKAQAATSTIPVQGLPSWREVMEPHQDVAQGRYRRAEFAADLSQVAQGKAKLEYRDPVEFFNRTYVTEGMKGLLTQSLKRVSGKEGEPVIQLKTAFGGGKTHSMLALYHMMRSYGKTSEIPAIRDILVAAGVESVPEVHVATIVGTAIDPASSKRPADLPGVKINTVWGEIAYQLARSKGNPAIYEYVKEADKRGVSPGSIALTQMFDACGGVLVLMDELVAYAKKLYGQEKLPAGTLDNFITFIQEITEAARASKRSLVVASIPESDNEIGGEAGQRALEQIEHTFGRMEAIWKPVAAKEGFEVVRRRLFLNCKDEAARNTVCNAFSQMYVQNSADFPVESRELDYQQRLVSCYPIHPEVFDRLYEDWATLENFQRTRSVLRLMAAVIHELWMAQDASPMIMPGSLPLDAPDVRDELTRYLDDSWNAVVDSEVDGKSSIPFKNDKETPRYGKVFASRRVARTVMLGSAPDVGGQSVRGVEKARVRLGSIQPGENIAVFNDALLKLKTSSSFLYSDGGENRYWYDTRPTLLKQVEDRAQQQSNQEASYEVEERLRKLRRIDPLGGLGACPSSTLDIPDEQQVRLVIVSPDRPHRNGASDSPALAFAKEALASRGTSPRMNKNMLVFVAADSGVVGDLLLEAKRYLAWRSIERDVDSINLDRAQIREMNQSIARTNDLLDRKIQEAYCWLIVPRIDRGAGLTETDFVPERMAGSGEGLVQKAITKLRGNEDIVDVWAPALLTMELDNLLWKDGQHIQVKQLWDYLCTYCYLPRLANYGVLESAIRRGIESKDFFALAQGMSDGRYVGLSLGQPVQTINTSDYLVKPSVAKAQIERDEEARLEEERRRLERERQRRELAEQSGNDGVVFYPDPADAGSLETSSGGASSTFVVSTKGSPDPTFFYMNAALDSVRVSRDIRMIMEEIVSQLEAIDGAKVELSFEVRAEVPDGFQVPEVRTISENCSTLGINDFGFEG